MDKEKEIEELTAKIVERNCYHQSCDDCERKHSRGGCEEEDIYRDITRYFIEAGYRKADEVRKETAKEVLQDVKTTLAFYMVHGGYCDDWKCGKVVEFIDRIINDAEKKYGVEVDE